MNLARFSRVFPKMRFFFLVFLSLFLFDISDALAQGNPGWWNGNETQPFAGGVIRAAYCDMIGYMEGEFGGLLTVIAGILAFATAAFGSFKHGVTLIVTAVGAFSISAVVSLYFGNLCGGNAAARVSNQNQELNAALAIGAGRNVDFENTQFQPLDDSQEFDPFF